MSPRELDALMIRLGRAEIEFKRIPAIPYLERTDENLAPLRAAHLKKLVLEGDLLAEAVERALAGGVE